MVWAVTVMGGIAKGDSAVSTCWVCDGRAGLPLGLLGWACFSCRLSHPIQRSRRGEAQLRKKKNFSDFETKETGSAIKTNTVGRLAISRKITTNEVERIPPQNLQPQAGHESTSDDQVARTMGGGDVDHGVEGIRREVSVVIPS